MPFKIRRFKGVLFVSWCLYPFNKKSVLKRIKMGFNAIYY